VAVLPAVVGNDAVLTSLTNRFATLSNLDEDESRQERQALYDSAPTLIMSAPFGTGLGVIGGAARLGPSGATVDFDSGYLGRTLEGGLPGLVLYLIPQILLLFAAVKIWLRARLTDDIRLQAIAGLAAAHIVAFAFLQFGHDGNGLPTLGFWLIESLSISSLPMEKSVSRLRAQPA
jgi:O-antigen ligase